MIRESKKRKAERQKNKEDTVEATEQLDEDWKTLGMIVTSNKDTEETLSKESHQKNDNYDIVMRQLKFEPHGQVGTVLIFFHLVHLILNIPFVSIVHSLKKKKVGT